MSAINAFYDRDDCVAYLATDGAAFSYANGTVEALGGKASLFPQFNIALAMTGPNFAAEIVAHVCRQLPLDQADILRHLQETVVLARHGMAQGKPEGELSGVNDLTMVAAVFLETEKRPALFRIDTRPASFTGLIPNRWHEIEGVFIPSTAPPLHCRARLGWTRCYRLPRIIPRATSSRL